MKPLTPEHRAVLRKALDTYGKTSQITMAFEEMSELMKELSKNLRGRDNRSEIAEEIADVEIMLEQMKMLFDCEKSVYINRQAKIDRLEYILGREVEE